MRIGLYNLEPQYVNTAMMQVSMYHRLNNDLPEPYDHFIHDQYGKIYAFSIFDFTPKHYVTKDMICGGTGFNVLSRLPPDIEACDYDYEIFPECDHSIVWFSRGCSRNCGFCVVPRKEGRIHPVQPKPLNENGKWIKVMDNNFFGNPEWRAAVKQLQEWGQPVDFQGVDARILDKEMCEALNTLKHRHQIHIAWDDPRDDLASKLSNVTQWIKPYKLMCYVLVGYNSTPEQDLERVEALRKLKIDPFVMVYNRSKESSDFCKRFARWVNHKAIFKSIPWSEYKDPASLQRFQEKKKMRIEVKKEKMQGVLV